MTCYFNTVYVAIFTCLPKMVTMTALTCFLVVVCAPGGWDCVCLAASSGLSLAGAVTDMYITLLYSYILCTCQFLLLLLLPLTVFNNIHVKQNNAHQFTINVITSSFFSHKQIPVFASSLVLAKSNTHFPCTRSHYSSSQLFTFSPKSCFYLILL